jgi:hypothetical protein
MSMSQEDHEKYKKNGERYRREFAKKRDENTTVGSNGKKVITNISINNKAKSGQQSHGRANRAGTGCNSQKESRDEHRNKRKNQGVNSKMAEEQDKSLESAGNHSTLAFVDYVTGEFTTNVSNISTDLVGKKNSKSSKKLSKKDIIVLENVRRITLKSIEEDEKRIHNIGDITNYSEILTYFKKLTNYEQQVKYLFVALSKYYEIYNSKKSEENRIVLLELILHIDYLKNDTVKIDDELMMIYTKSLEITDDMNREKLLFEQTIEPVPNNAFKLKQFKLEDFQVNLIKSLNAKKNVIASCSTGSGKSVISLSYLASINNGIFIAPNAAVVNQLAALLINGNYIPNGIGVISHEYIYTTSDNPTKIIGTPIEVEKYLLDKNKFTFDVIVFDEIHLLNVTDTLEDINYSNSIKRMILKLQGQKVFLSATLTNESIDNIVNIVDDCVIIKYNKRFTVLQNQVITVNKLKNINALGYLDIKEDWSKLNIELTPLEIWDFFEKYLEDVDEFVSSKFKGKMFSLDDISNLSKGVIKIVKNELSSSSDDDIEEIKDILSSFKSEVKSEPLDIYDEILLVKNKDQFPLCDFRNDPLGTGIELLNRLHQEQDKKYPTWLFDKKRNTKNIEKNMKMIDKLKDNSSEKKNIKNATCKQDRDKMFKDIGSSKERNDEKISSLQEETMSIDTNIHAPHPDYFMGRIQISDDKMRQIKRFLSKLYNKNVDYSNPLLDSIQFGIAIYDKNMPIFYLNIILDLIKGHHIGILFADTSIGAGLDMPFRTVIPNEMASTQSRIQQQGRAGRRGLDTKGFSIINDANIIDNMNAQYPSVDITLEAKYLRYTDVVEPFIHFKTKKKSDNYLMNLNRLLNDEEVTITDDSIDTIYIKMIQSCCREDELKEYLGKTLYLIETYDLNNPINAKFVTSIGDYKQTKNLSSIILLYILNDCKEYIVNIKNITHIETKNFFKILLCLFNEGTVLVENELSGLIFDQFEFEFRYNAELYDAFVNNKSPDDYNEKFFYKNELSKIRIACESIDERFDDPDIQELILGVLKKLDKILEKCHIL